MNILDNETVRKYFGCHPQHNHWGEFGAKCRNEQAMAILEAMHQPLRKGERYLNQANRTDWILIEDCPKDINDWHPFALRLPDKFQEQGKEEHVHWFQCACGAFKWHGVTQEPEPPKCGCPDFDYPGAQPNVINPVEAKIKEIAGYAFPGMTNAKEAFMPRLRELVELARTSK